MSDVLVDTTLFVGVKFIQNLTQTLVVICNGLVASCLGIVLGSMCVAAQQLTLRAETREVNTAPTSELTH